MPLKHWHGYRWFHAVAIFRLLSKFAIKSVHRCTLLMMRRSRYPYHKPFENSLSRSVHPCTLLDASFCAAKTSLLREPRTSLSVLQIQGANKNKAEPYLLYGEYLFLCSNAVDGMHIFKRTRGCISHGTPSHIKNVYPLRKDLQTQSREQRNYFWEENGKISCVLCYEWYGEENAEQI